MPRRLLANQVFDGSGRLAFILTLGFEGCLFLFTEAAFEKAIARLETEPFAGEQARNMQRLFFSKVQRVELDEKNRLSVPERLRELVGIERDVVIVGLVGRAEIWAKAKWEAFDAEHAREFAQLDRVLLGGGAGAPRA